jgi:methylenetetrahydrofolate dehydrogenase (NADP+)/methenyltetrahydrofolate cyclohydrolase
MAKILDGKSLAAQIRADVKTRVKNLEPKPGLGVILVGADPASHTYVALKRKACEEAGINFEQHLYFATEKEETILKQIKGLNSRPEINGILVQLPLPSQDADRIITAIDPKKDVDGFHTANLQLLREGKPSLVSAVALGIMKLVDVSGEKPKNAVIVSSPLFAEPIQILLDERGIETSVVQKNSANFAQETRAADLLITATGSPGIITSKEVKPGAVVIDVGTTRLDDGLKGDVDFESVEPIASAITPVPGGVGPMTVAMLLENILRAYETQKK